MRDSGPGEAIWIAALGMFNAVGRVSVVVGGEVGVVVSVG